MTIKTKKEKSSIALPEDFPVCELCAVAGIQTRIRPDKKAVTHHFHYDPPVTATLCFACHQALHFQGPVYNHPLKRQFKDENDRRALVPILFAYAVVGLYERKMLMGKQLYIMIEPPISKGSNREN